MKIYTLTTKLPSQTLLTYPSDVLLCYWWFVTRISCTGTSAKSPSWRTAQRRDLNDLIKISYVWPVERNLQLPSISCGFESMRKKRNKCHAECTATKRVAWLVIPWHYGFGEVKDVTTTFIFYIGMFVVWTDGRANGHVITKIYRMDRLPKFS